ncbi:hypothetical protein A3K73_00235 [Candidatus Pacearchaeota archaeon RBG_13_36_9]|nr:MAG: hypothetical protein A3K73_00235 [Candidatus Pacearchaeota archaeon RBG_13_36_9]
MVDKLKLIYTVLILSALLVSPVLAGDFDIAYIYSSQNRIDNNIIRVFSGLNLSVELINENSIPKDFSQYKLIFIGDEKISKPIAIEQYPSIVISYHMGQETGLTDNDGISKMASVTPLKVKFKGKEVIVYTSGRDPKGIAIPYYFLDNENKIKGLIKYAGTYSTSSGKDFGDVISFAEKGTVLSNGKIVNSGMCFFGIIKSDYWTTEAENLFLDCVKYVYDYTYQPPVEPITCSLDSDCATFSGFSGYFCSGNDVAQNYTVPKCINPGTEGSFCSYEKKTEILENCSLCLDGVCKEVNCSSNADCYDGILFTEDTCISPGTENATCENDFQSNLQLVTVIAVASQNSVSLSLNYQYPDISGIKGYYLSENGVDWEFVPVVNTSYTFSNLDSSTNYTFYIQIIDQFDLVLQEIVIPVTTLASPSTSVVTIVASGGGGGSCKTQWTCTEWGECKNNIQIRTCSYPANFCKPLTKKPTESQSCIPEENILSQPTYTEEITVPEEIPEEPGNKAGMITGASIVPESSFSSDKALLISSLFLMGLIITYFILSAPKK